MAEISAIDTDLAVDGSGSEMLRVPVVKQILLSVDIVTLGILVDTIVMTSQYRVVLDLYEVSNFTLIVFFVFSPVSILRKIVSLFLARDSIIIKKMMMMMIIIIVSFI